MRPPHTRSTLFPYTTLFRSVDIAVEYFLNRQEHKQSVHKFWVGNHQISCLHNLLSKTNDVQIENSGRPSVGTRVATTLLLTAFQPVKQLRRRPFGCHLGSAIQSIITDG